MNDRADATKMWRFGPYGFLIFVALGIAGLVALGKWQPDRLAHKEAVIAQRQAMLVQPPVTLDKINATPPAWRRVRLRGQFLHDQFFLVGPRSYHGMPHWRLVTPLRLAADEHVLIDRGWVLYDRKTWGRKAISEPSGIVSVDGFVRYPRSPGPFVPDVVAPPSGREWIRLIPNVVGGHLRLEPVATF